VHSPLSEESSNEPALLRQTTSRVTLGLDDICHSQKFKISPLAFSARARECQRVRLAGRRDSKEGRRGLTFSLAHHKPVG
jgi:hypothetical protein